MPELAYPYAEENGKVILELDVSSPDQLIDRASPVPFDEQALNASVEEYLMETVRDFPDNAQFRIAISVPTGKKRSPDFAALPDALRNHFRYKMLVMDRKYRHWIRFGKQSFVMALIVLALATFTCHAVLMFGETLPYQMISDAASIIGWVAMSAPATVILLELWPVLETKKIYEKIAGSEIVIVSGA